MNLAVFGGSFDPPHIGHELIVLEALKTLHVEKIFVVPTFLNPFKDGFDAPPNLRLKWLHKLFDKNDRIEILDFEIRQKRATPTIETIRYIKQKFKPKKIYLIIGADNYKKLPLWSSFEELKSLVEFVIASRDDIITPTELKKIKIDIDISSCELRKDLDLSYIPNQIRDEVETNYKGKM